MEPKKTFTPLDPKNSDFQDKDKKSVSLKLNKSPVLQGGDLTGFTAEEAKKIGEELGIDWSKFDVEQFRKGMDVELEHGLRDTHTNVTDDDPLVTGKIALAHLNEFPDYYTRLDEMEEKAKEYWGEK